ncbi:MAG TPA: GNAT family N-acetyltransferase [Gaiellaceae bacterium]|nr:GNAT family N-acetyltransferase [Gaiellaceae bacterium]
MIAVRLAASDADHEVWTRLQNAVEPEAPSTVDDLRDSLRRQPGGACGSPMSTARPSAAPSSRRVGAGRVFVLPRGRRRGLGSALLAAGLASARTLGSERSRTSVDGSDGRSLAWAQQRGYEEVDLRVELVRPLVAPGVADWPSSGLSAAPVDELLDELQLRPPVVNRPRPRRADGVAGLLPYGTVRSTHVHDSPSGLPRARDRARSSARASAGRAAGGYASS